MNYSDYLLSYKIYKKRVFRFVLLNICLFIGVLIFHRETWHDRFIMTVWIVLLVMIITHFVKKLFKVSQMRLKEIEQTVGNEPIYHCVDNFIGIVKGNIWNYKALLLVYSLFLLFVLVFLYYELLSSLVLVVILGTMHLVFMMPIVFALNRLGTSACFFTSKTLIVNRTTLIAYEHIKKYQFIELIKGGYYLDINSIEGFARLKIDEAQYTDIKNLISNHA
ncbi:hypothetical protein [Fusibacter sp. 3D3]|uniref:hypothetical protein n=1 Tax=Fusibacter sp. 3D3 TaxID=1048380 RepID=UPI000852B007|nr:hypothetical protein [Fusibacter sp. 3D3]GAU79229.1 hypothetical protein F3D3_3887 [Fusibacter sp. 3D3]